MAQSPRVDCTIAAADFDAASLGQQRTSQLYFASHGVPTVGFFGKFAAVGLIIDLCLKRRWVEIAGRAAT
jgi:hypothetical protein